MDTDQRISDAFELIDDGDLYGGFSEIGMIFCQIEQKLSPEQKERLLSRLADFAREAVKKDDCSALEEFAFDLSIDCFEDGEPAFPDTESIAQGAFLEFLLDLFREEDLNSSCFFKLFKIIDSDWALIEPESKTKIINNIPRLLPNLDSKNPRDSPSEICALNVLAGEYCAKWIIENKTDPAAIRRLFKALSDVKNSAGEAVVYEIYCVLTRRKEKELLGLMERCFRSYKKK